MLPLNVDRNEGPLASKKYRLSTPKAQSSAATTTSRALKTGKVVTYCPQLRRYDGLHAYGYSVENTCDGGQLSSRQDKDQGNVRLAAQLGPTTVRRPPPPLYFHDYSSHFPVGLFTPVGSIRWSFVIVFDRNIAMTPSIVYARVSQLLGLIHLSVFFVLGRFRDSSGVWFVLVLIGRLAEVCMVLPKCQVR